MLNRINNILSNIKDENLKKKYYELIITLLEKGYFPGLAGVPVVKSQISHIDGEKGILTYRGYPVQELAENCTYENVCFLLLNGDLPLSEEKNEFRQKLLENRKIHPNIARVIALMDKDLHPMYMLSSSVLLLQSDDKDAFDVERYQQNLLRSISLIAKLPTIIGIFRNRDPEFAVNEQFTSFAQYCLYCFNQELAAEKQWVDFFEKILILHGDHTMNNSTFSARAVSSSMASIYASISSAINSLSGPLHGGANERVIKMLEEIGSPERVESYVDDKLSRGEKIMGIGHRIYKTYDPRALYIKEKILPIIFEDKEAIRVDDDLMNLYQIAQRLEEVALDRLSDKKLYPNVDFWSGLVLKAMKIEPRYFTTIFALGRIMGWCSHYLEHMKVKNRIYRPEQLYDGFGIRHILVNQDEEKVNRA
ncbi:MAG: citrate synthase [Halanaerobiales bacterium]|nr:citrate synthase [Halanaerobiales bacterium]